MSKTVEQKQEAYKTKQRRRSAVLHLEDLQKKIRLQKRHVYQLQKMTRDFEVVLQNKIEDAKELCEEVKTDIASDNTPQQG